MDETAPEVDVWEFEAIVDAAVFSALYHDRTEDSFTDQVFEVYLVIERRVREADNTVLVGVPDNPAKEETVKSMAEKLEDGFEKAERLAKAKSHYEEAPTGSTNQFETGEAYWEEDDFDPYT